MESERIVYPREPLRFGANDLESLLSFAVKLGASDVTIQSGEQIIIDISGRLNKVTKRKLTTNEVGDLLNYIYGANGTTQLLSGTDVDTHYEFRPSRLERYRFRVNATACQVEGHHGIQLTLRTIPLEPLTLKALKLEAKIVDAISPQEGVVYVTGATGSGKTTLLAAIIREIASTKGSNRKILTYESPIEFVFDTIDKPDSVVSQSEIPRHLPSFAAGVRNALRRKPRLILVGEARDPETISAVLEAALTGHPVYTTLHTTGVAETVRRLVGTFPIEERHGRAIDIVETMRLIIWQKLVPTVDGKQVALREYLVFDEEVRDKMLSSDLDRVTTTTRKLLHEYGRPMILDAKEKYAQGIISEHVFKILEAGTRYADRDAGLI